MHPVNPQDVTIMRIFVYAAVGAFVGTFIGLWRRHRERARWVRPVMWNGHGFSAAEDPPPPADLSAWWPSEGPRQ